MWFSDHNSRTTPLQVKFAMIVLQVSIYPLAGAEAWKPLPKQKLSNGFPAMDPLQNSDRCTMLYTLTDKLRARLHVLCCELLKLCAKALPSQGSTLCAARERHELSVKLSHITAWDQSSTNRQGFVTFVVPKMDISPCAVFRKAGQPLLLQATVALHQIQWTADVVSWNSFANVSYPICSKRLQQVFQKRQGFFLGKLGSLEHIQLCARATPGSKLARDRYDLLQVEAKIQMISCRSSWMAVLSWSNWQDRKGRCPLCVSQVQLKYGHGGGKLSSPWFHLPKKSANFAAVTPQTLQPVLWASEPGIAWYCHVFVNGHTLSFKSNSLKIFAV